MNNKMMLHFHHFVLRCFVNRNDQQGVNVNIRFVLPLVLVTCLVQLSRADEVPIVSGVEAQPLKAQVKRVAQALQFLGQPLDDARQAALDKALKETNDSIATEAIQKALDPLVLAAVNINAESRVKVSIGEAKKELIEQGWSIFLVKVHNQAGVTAQLKVASPNAAPLYFRSRGGKDPEPKVKPEDVPDRWLDISSFDKQPLNTRLSGLEVEYRIVELYSRDRGKREATISFNVGQGTQDIGFRNEIAVLFKCRPAVQVQLDVIDDDGKPTTGQFVIRDAKDRVYPSRARRLAPDFFFHDQIYRHSGEYVALPPGEYDVAYTRGPEYQILKRKVTVPNTKKHKETFRLKRWIKLTDKRWYSGDHHVHAAGCSHYESPTQGVTPEAMMRHILGEDLNVGCVLSWGPCWYHQKQFFSSDVDKLSTDRYLMRYDVEVSGFPSSHAGHLCLLNLREDDYAYPTETAFDWKYDGLEGTFKGTKTEAVGEWPSWDLPVLRWGKEQGGVVGFSHSGWGLQLPDHMPDGTRQFPPGRWGGANPDWKGREPNKLPDYAMPRFDGIGANEYVVDVVHDVCDFISAVDTPIIWELNVWYHTLNCGYTCRISGETDFPCIYGDRVGLGRVYVKLDEGQPLTYEKWIHGIRDGRSYCSDGLSHLYDFTVNGLGVGEKGDGDRSSVLAVKSGEVLKIAVDAAALLNETPRDDIRNKRLDQKPYWHVERARIDASRKVPVELIVNGYPVERKTITADGSVTSVKFNYKPKQSSWVAVRILPSSHTNPVFVEVDGKPIRASKRSAQWCLDAVDVCWNSKKGNTRKHELASAEAAYNVAREAYRKILAESYDDLEGK